MNAGHGSNILIIFWLVSKYDTDHLNMSLPKGDGMKIYLFGLHNVVTGAGVEFADLWKLWIPNGFQGKDANCLLGLIRIFWPFQRISLLHRIVNFRMVSHLIIQWV